MPHPPIDSLRFADPLPASSPEDAFWYHSFTWPDGSETVGSWDHRGKEEDYLGRQDFDEKTVLEIGPGSGFLTKEMEARGAFVTCIDGPEDEPWEAVPRRDIDITEARARHSQSLAGMRRSWWYSQGQFGGAARVAYAGVSALPTLKGEVRFDIALIACVLEHVRHPVDVLYDVADVAETIIVTEPAYPRLEKTGLAAFRPGPENEIWGTWWHLPSPAVEQVLATARFRRETHYAGTYTQLRGGEEGERVSRELFTSVFRRT
jgi:SAM-dependent methyltransferase